MAVMRRGLLAAILVLLLIPQPRAEAVQLEAGWTAQFSVRGLMGTNGNGNWGGTWLPISPTGQFGPLDVEPSLWGDIYGRQVTVTQAVDAATGPLWEDAGSIPDFFQYYQSVLVSWYTDYDASKLRLQLAQRTQYSSLVLWQQKISGPAIGGTTVTVFLLSPADHLVMRLAVVPEPSAIGVLTLGLSGLLFRRPSFPKGVLS